MHLSVASSYRQGAVPYTPISTRIHDRISVLVSRLRWLFCSVWKFRMIIWQRVPLFDCAHVDCTGLTGLWCFWRLSCPPLTFLFTLQVIYFLEKAGENVKGLVEKMRASVRLLVILPPSSSSSSSSLPFQLRMLMCFDVNTTRTLAFLLNN